VLDRGRRHRNSGSGATVGQGCGDDWVHGALDINKAYDYKTRPATKWERKEIRMRIKVVGRVEEGKAVVAAASAES